MDKNQHVPSPAQAEEFWTEGQDAIQSATGTDLEPGTSTTESADAEYTEKRCSLCGAKRLSSGVCSLVPGRDGTGGCPDPMYDYRREKESVGIDLPGVGVIRSAEVSSDLAGREAVDGIGERSPDPVDVAFEALLKSGLKEIFITPAGVEALSDIAAGVEPEPPAERRERLFSQLVFAAKALADAQIEPATESEPAFCVECVKDAYDRGAIAHEDTCRTGRVFSVIAALVATLSKTEQPASTGDMWQQVNFSDLVLELGGLVCRANPKSARSGLEILTAAFGCLLDIYADPNPENPAGMCDDKAAFRKFFAQILEGGAR